MIGPKTKQWVLVIGLFLFSCKESEKSGSDTTGHSQASASERPHPDATPPTLVKTMTLTPSDFQQELVANGKLEAVRKANLRFRMDGMIEQVHVAEGVRVSSGQLLVSLSQENNRFARQQTALRYRKAKLDYEDQLLRQGYRLADTADLSAEIKLVTRLRSGLSDAETDLERSEAERKNHFLNAPFAGKIANLKASPYNNASTFEYICTLVDDNELHVAFQVLEQELDFVRSSRQVTVSSFSDPQRLYTGTIESINPLVDQGGMVSVKARVSNADRKLLDGMGVRVVVNKSLPGRLVVPKEAVLERQGRKVVFTASDAGLAYWNYVETGLENNHFFTIENGLSPGDRVIYSGNFNLAHDKPIRITADH